MGEVIAAPTRHKLSVGDREWMAEAGIFGEEHRIELLDGDLTDMAPISVAHASIVMGLTGALSMACAGRAHVSPQNPVQLDWLSLPQLDLVFA